ncbi:hypothetical protein B0H10DRAFT_1355767 [Mycena sp. CBHHK59/15]|nr:hypothetical protein B0H10DRAFT_1355767 [Mycena sp. CBHHK59/15]
MNAIANFLDMYSVTERSIFCGKPGTSGLEPLLQRPSTPTPSQGRSQPYDNTKTLPHLAIPFYSAMRPDVLLVVASGTPFFSFKQADVTFASNMGVVLVAHLVQSSIVESDAAKTAFVSQISHELRTPLHGLLGQLELLRDGFSSGDLSMVPNLLDSAEYCGVTLRDIVNDVLDFGKLAQLPPDGPDTAVRPQETALVDLVQITLETSRSCWLRRQQWRAISGDKTAERNRGGMSAPVELVVEYEDRSMLEKGWWVSLDVPGFRRILNNLMTNSLKYTAEGLITVSLVSQDGVDRNGQVCQQIALRVQDTGLGITPEFMDKLFEPFTQEDSFSPGAGLGLHITKSIVDRMHGDINAECRVGVGTTFTVILPVEDVEPRPPDKPTTMQQSIISQFARDAHGLSAPSPTFSDATLVASPSPPLPQLALQDRATPNGVSGSKLERDKEEEEEPEEPMKVLVVDDNAISRKILIAMLKRSNATAYQADDGLNALEVFREVHPHVVWTDVSMPRSVYSL